MTDLAQAIQTMPLADTHEYQTGEDEYVNHPPDILEDLFASYLSHDLIAAGAATLPIYIRLKAIQSSPALAGMLISYRIPNRS